MLAEPLQVALLDGRAEKQDSEAVLDALRSDLSAVYGDALRWVPYFERTPAGDVTLRIRLMACGADFGARLVSGSVVGTASSRTSATAATPWGPVVAAGTSEQQLLASVIQVYEVYKVVRRDVGEERAVASVAAMRCTHVEPLDESLALEAADLSLEHGLAMADAIILATARRHGAEIVTADADFEGFPEATVVR